jgi:hypothetical protein
MNNDPQFWYEAGKADRRAGNEVPAVTAEDFFRELGDNPENAKECSDAYKKGFSLQPQ